MDGAITAIGLMSGTSLDGIDAAILRTDGLEYAEPGAFISRPYPPDLQEALRDILGTAAPQEAVARVEAELTRAHAAVIEHLLEEAGVSSGDIDIIGFHGHTVDHRPADGCTRQIGDGALLAELSGRPVVNDFRSADVAAGGEGAPFASLYHAALASRREEVIAILNIGGVANVTWLGKTAAGADPAIVAFDTGPGNALLDDWTRQQTGRLMDEGGRLAAAGQVDEPTLRHYLQHPYFVRRPPKSLDRNDFSLEPVSTLAPEDGAATLTAFTAASVAEARRHFPEKPARWLVTGGGRHNDTLMAALRGRLAAPVTGVEEAGWRGDALEAEAFAYLAVRSLKGLPLSLPSTTGCRAPTLGGRLWKVKGG